MRGFLFLLLALTAHAAVPACKNYTGKCPVWPKEFTASFGLYENPAPLNPNVTISNAPSVFYYKFLENGTQAQRISYGQCLPYLFPGASDSDCDLYFNHDGIFLHLPDKLQCCRALTAFGSVGVGAVPREFLRAYSFQGTHVKAKDQDGKVFDTDLWTVSVPGLGDYAYNTISPSDPSGDVGRDVVFQDGSATGTLWRWGNFTYDPVPDAMFKLPGDAMTCNKTCESVLSEEGAQLLEDHLLKLRQFI